MNNKQLYLIFAVTHGLVGRVIDDMFLIVFGLIWAIIALWAATHD